jgi:hypothetical protein
MRLPLDVPDEPIVFDRYPIWDRQEGERMDWYEAFASVYLMNPKPNVNQAFFAWQKKREQCSETKAKLSKRANDGWYAIVKAFRWKERHEAYWIARNKENIAFIEYRRRKLQEKIFKLAEAAIDKAGEMLSHPTRFTQVAKTDEHGRPIIYNVYPTENWSLKDATKMVVEASQLMNFADEITPEDVAIDMLLKKGFEINHPALRLIEEKSEKSRIAPSSQGLLLAEDSVVDEIINADIEE